MKAQLGIESLIAMIVFISFVSYFFYQILLSPPSYLRELKRETVNSEAFQVSELLINDEGEPSDWYLDGKDIKRIGLADEIQKKTNFLSLSKINKLQDLCNSDYENVKKLIGTDYSFRILFVERTAGATLIKECKPTVIAGSEVNITLRRIVAFDVNRYGELILEMW